jgi:SAM-dependent methyltransferase
MPSGASTPSLTFGCGSARVLRHFRCIRDLYWAGTDANPKPIEWARGNLDGIDFRINQLEPPLPFEDGSFDVIYALSVFTHIPLEWQRPWLEELRRVLRPGGYLICTVLGVDYVRQMLSSDDQARLQQDGELVLDRNDPRASYSTKVLGSWDVFQQREQVRDVFGSVFAIRRYTDVTTEQDMLVMGQDMLVLQRE